MGGEELKPRLCTIKKWHDFPGYGFNLHAERGRAGQYIGKVDDGSPAQAAGMKEGDRIVEVEGTNIGNENHSQVVTRIKAAGECVTMLLVDAETDKYYKEQKLVVSSQMSDVIRMETPPRPGANEQKEEESEPPAEPPSYNEVQQADEEAQNETPLEQDRSPSPDTVPAVAKTPSHNYHPRLCKIRKWPDFQGYGFNLHAEKEKKGQYIGLIDANSPAEDADLRKGDRIIEVNGENIEDETHQQVIQKIKAGGDRTDLLVVDPEADEYYKNNGIRITTDLPEVIVNETRQKEASAMTFHPRVCHVIKWPDFPGYGFNLHAEKERGGQYIGKIDDNSPAQDAGLREHDRIIEVNNVNIENETHQQVIGRIKAGGDETKLLVVDKEADAYYKSRGITVTSSMPEVQFLQTTRRSPRTSANVANGDSTPATRVEPTIQKSEPAPAQANGGDLLSMNLSAKEMRERIAQKKKKDPKQKSNMDFKSKYEIFQKM